MMKYWAMMAALALAVITPASAVTSRTKLIRTLANMEAVNLFSGNKTISTVSIGHSALGQTIPLVVIRDTSVPIEETSKLFIICRQHGNEPASTEAMFGMIKTYFAHPAASDLDILRRVTFVIVPMMNPDGADKNKRRNGHGKDLNRDWIAQSQPETRAVIRAIDKWQPDIIIDEHELDIDDYRGDFIESMGQIGQFETDISARSAELQSLIISKLKTHGYKVRSVRDKNNVAPRLAHRYFSAEQAKVALLLESRRSGSRRYNLNERARMHLVSTMTAARYLAGDASTVRHEVARWQNDRYTVQLASRGGKHRTKTRVQKLKLRKSN